MIQEKEKVKKLLEIESKCTSLVTYYVPEDYST
jgi:hypothetical protein